MGYLAYIYLEEYNMSKTIRVRKMRYRDNSQHNFKPLDEEITKIQQFQFQRYQRAQNQAFKRCVFLILHNFCLKNYFQLFQRAYRSI